MLYQDLNVPISVTRLLASPKWMYRIILHLNALGVWGMDRGSPVKGDLLWSVWLIEAVIIFTTAAAISRRIARKRPFCESCRQWAAGPLTLASTSVLDAADLKHCLESRQYDFVPQLPRYGGIAGEYLAWEYFQCPSCKEFNALSVTRIIVARDKGGRTRKTRRTIIDKLLLAASDLARLQAKPAAAAPGRPIARRATSPGARPSQRHRKQNPCPIPQTIGSSICNQSRGRFLPPAFHRITNGSRSAALIRIGGIPGVSASRFASRFSTGSLAVGVQRANDRHPRRGRLRRIVMPHFTG